MHLVVEISADVLTSVGKGKCAMASHVVVYVFSFEMAAVCEPIYTAAVLAVVPLPFVLVAIGILRNEIRQSIIYYEI